MLLIRNPYSGLLRRLYDSPGADGYPNHQGSTTVYSSAKPTKLPMTERVGYKKLIHRFYLIHSISFFITTLLSLKKNQNAPRPSEHPPVRGEKCQNV